MKLAIVESMFLTNLMAGANRGLGNGRMADGVSDRDLEGWVMVEILKVGDRTREKEHHE